MVTHNLRTNFFFFKKNGIYNTFRFISTTNYTTIQISSRGNSIGCKPRIKKRRSQVRIPLPPTLTWKCKKKKKKKKKNYTTIQGLYGFSSKHGLSIKLNSTNHYRLSIQFSSLNLLSILIENLFFFFFFWQLFFSIMFFLLFFFFQEFLKNKIFSKLVSLF
jgi:hypothetical protein